MYKKEDLKNIYAGRRSKMADFLKENNTGCAVFIDSEEHRDPSIRYYTGNSTLLFSP